MWVFECLEWDSSKRRLWRYHPVPRGTSDYYALAVVDALCGDAPATGEVPRTGAATYAISDGGTVTCVLAATSDVDVEELREAVRRNLPVPVGVVDLDTDLCVSCLVRVGAEPEVIEAARRLLAARPDCYVATPST